MKATVLLLGMALAAGGCGGAVVPGASPTTPTAVQSTPVSAPPAGSSQPTPGVSPAAGCPSVATNEGGAPEPVAPPDNVGTLRLGDRVKLPQEAMFVAASEDGLWVTSPAGKLWRIDAETRKVTVSVDLPDLGLARPLITSDALWLAEMRSGRLLRLDPEVGSILSTIPLEPAERPMAIAATGNGVLVGNQTTNTLTLVNAATMQVADQIDLSKAAPGAADRAPAAVVVQGETAWVVEHRAHAIARVDLTDGSATRTCVGDPAAGQMVAAAARLWVAGAGGVVSIVDPESGEVTARLGLPAITAGDLVVDGDMVWVGAGSHVVGIDAIAGEVRIAAATGDLSDEREFPGGVAIAVTSDSVWTTDPGGFGLLRFVKAGS